MKDPGDRVPNVSIPSSGRGNSIDGKTWINPSPNQLARALARNEKPIREEDKFDVAAMHDFITSGTWSEIMRYEELHPETTEQVTLSSFHGMDGIWSPKAVFVHYYNYLRYGVDIWPYDRHDWIVNRGDREVRYVIDYYGEGDEYTIDARPALDSIDALIDRVKIVVEDI